MSQRYFISGLQSLQLIVQGNRKVDDIMSVSVLGGPQQFTVIKVSLCPVLRLHSILCSRHGISKSEFGLSGSQTILS